MHADRRREEEVMSLFRNATISNETITLVVSHHLSSRIRCECRASGLCPFCRKLLESHPLPAVHFSARGIHGHGGVLSARGGAWAPGACSVGLYRRGMAGRRVRHRVAARHLWIQSLPADQVPSCGPPLDYMFSAFPFAKVLKLVFTGSGECAKVESILGLPMPGMGSVLVCRADCDGNLGCMSQGVIEMNTVQTSKPLPMASPDPADRGGRQAGRRRPGSSTRRCSSRRMRTLRNLLPLYGIWRSCRRWSHRGR